MLSAVEEMREMQAKAALARAKLELTEVVSAPGSGTSRLMALGEAIQEEEAALHNVVVQMKTLLSPLLQPLLSVLVPSDRPASAEKKDKKADKTGAPSSTPSLVSLAQREKSIVKALTETPKKEHSEK